MQQRRTRAVSHVSLEPSVADMGPRSDSRALPLKVQLDLLISEVSSFPTAQRQRMS